MRQEKVLYGSNFLDICINTAILAEYEQVLSRPKFSEKIHQSALQRFFDIIYDLGIKANIIPSRVSSLIKLTENSTTWLRLLTQFLLPATKSATRMNRLYWTQARTDGSHHIFKNTSVNEIINIQNVNGEAKPYQIKQFFALIEKYNLDMEE